jgi:RNA polymerase sigma factor (sigma-70 family)
MGEFDHSTKLDRFLQMFRAGHESAESLLIEHALDRLQRLAQRMFRCQGNLRAIEQTDDVLQKALIRLHHLLAGIKPDSVRGFFALAAQQIRWVLKDLARTLVAGRIVVGKGAPLSDTGHQRLDEPLDPGGEPVDLAQWTDFHQKVESLPEEERELFDLIWYQGFTQAEAATTLNVSLRTLKRRWRSARLVISHALHDDWPSA